MISINEYFFNEKISSIDEYLLSKNQYDTFDINGVDDSEIKELMIDNIDKKYLEIFKIRTLKTGNIELISDNMCFNGHTGLKFVLYIKSKPMCIRRNFKLQSPWSKKIFWSEPPAKQGEYETIEELMKGFNEWLNKKTTI